MNKLSVGNRVEKNGDIGTVRFIGTVPPTSGEWIGIEWDDPSRGKHDGSKDGVTYFVCREKTGGSFVRPTVLNSGTSMVEAIKDRYVSSNDDENQAMYLMSTAGRLKKVEGVGMTKVQKEFQQLNKLKQIELRDQHISFGGPLGSLSNLTPNVQELDLSKNLLSSWNDVCDIVGQLPKLKVLNLSDNILCFDNIPDASPAFASLHTLVLNHCRLSWKEVRECSVLWPNISHLHLVGNLIDEITSPPSGGFSNLEVLNLSENSIKSWDEVRRLSAIPKLNTLLLNQCGFSSIKVVKDEFLNLASLSLSGNSFQSLDVFNEINNFPVLSRLNFTKNPVLNLEEYITMQGIIFAKIKKLQIFNNSSISEPERRSAEMDYLQKFGLEWKDSGGHQDPELNRPSEEFLKNHPRFMEIAEEYGAPGDHMLIKKSTAIKENLIEVMIEAPVKPSFKPVKRRLPLSMTVGNLKLFIQELTEVEMRKHRLVYVSKDDDTYIVDLHRDFKSLHDVSIEPLDRIQVLDAFQKMNKLSVGNRVEKNGDIGTVRFIGTVPPTSGEWIGIEWDDPSRGKHDGSKDGVTYFVCREKTGGSFVRPTVLNSGISMVEAIKDRYVSSNDDANQAMYLMSTAGRLKKVEGVGMTKVQKEFQQLNKLKQIGLRDQHISFGGPLGSLSSLTPNVQELDLSKNLLSSWNDVCDIVGQLSKLKVLSLSDNILCFDNIPDASPAFASLHTLVLNHCRLSWKEVRECSVLWPNISHLHLVGNLIDEITSPPSGGFSNLEVLNLSENSIKSWDEVRRLSAIPKLNTLLLNQCGFSSIKVVKDEFLNLASLSLSGNSFQSLDVFNEINNFPVLSRLNFTKNPVFNLEEYITMQGIIFAKIKKLQIFNNSSISEPERRSAELDYLQKFGLEWKDSGGHQDPELNRPSEEFLKNHPRFMEIAEEYGAPGDHMLIKKSTAIKENLIEVMIEAPVKPSFKPVKRRLPLSMTVGNLKLFIQKLTKVEMRKHRLVYVSKDDDSYIVDLHRDFETLHDVSIEPLDRIQVLEAFRVTNFRTNKWKPKKLGA